MKLRIHAKPKYINELLSDNEDLELNITKANGKIKLNLELQTYDVLGGDNVFVDIIEREDEFEIFITGIVHLGAESNVIEIFADRRKLVTRSQNSEKMIFSAEKDIVFNSIRNNKISKVTMSYSY